jgi:malate dehydrogenase
MSRDDLLLANYEVVKTATEQAAKQSPNAILILVTNPLDAMCWTAMKVSGFPRERVIGMAGVLDTARFRTFIAEELGVSFENVTAMVLGGHGKQAHPTAALTPTAFSFGPATLVAGDHRLPPQSAHIRSPLN